MLTIGSFCVPRPRQAILPQGPHNHLGPSVLRLGCVSAFAVLIPKHSLTSSARIFANVLWCAKINRDKAAGKYDQFAGCGDDRDPEFRMVL